MRVSRREVLLIGVLWIAACDSDRVAVPGAPVVLDFDFATDASGWRAAFTDYPQGRENDVAFVGEVRTLPAPLPPSDALYQHGDNISDDLFMYFDRQVDGLAPGARYRLSFHLGFASRYAQDCAAGVGSLVVIKAGASTIEPASAPDANGVMRINVDKGQQMNDGANAVMLGDIRNGLPGCDPNADHAVAQRGGMDHTIVVRADSGGRMWIFFGTESAFESVHDLYFTDFRVELTREMGHFTTRVSEHPLTTTAAIPGSR